MNQMKKQKNNKLPLEIVEIRISFDLKGTYKNTLFSDGSILHEPISSEEGSLIQAQQGY